MNKNIIMNARLLRVVHALFFASLLSLSSCSSGGGVEKKEVQEDKYLVSVKEIYKYTEQQMGLSVSFLFPHLNIKTKDIKSGIITYKLSYTTTYENDKITASGTLTLPDVSGEYPLVLVERGTILSDEDSPSNKTFPLYEGLSIFGYVVFVPDLIGYGDSKNIFHPYFDYKYTATASIDMYKAVKEYFSKDNKAKVKINDKFFISGYSQGGYSTIATYKYIVENNLDIEVKALGAGAGGYDIMSMTKNVLKKETYSKIIFLVMPLVTYNELYIKKPLSDIFNSPYDAEIKNVIDGKKEWKDIDQLLPKEIRSVFKTSLVDDLKADRTTFLTEQITKNSVHDWSPSIPVRLYHYPEDEIIPLATTTSTLETMKSKGATDVKYIEISKKLVEPNNFVKDKHVTAAFPSLYLSFLEFKKY